MSKDYAQLLAEKNKEIEDFMTDQDRKRKEFFEKLDKEAIALYKAVQKYVKTKKYDPDVFGELKKEGEEPEEKSGPKKKGRKQAALSEINEEIPNIKIKKEKISDVNSTTSSTLSSTSIISVKENVPIKSENVEMPAPTWIPPKKKAKEIKTERPSRSVRTTRTKGRKGNEESSTDRNSDVILQSANISTVSLSDTEESDSESKPAETESTTRSTRTKTRQKPATEKVRESSRTKKMEEESQSEVEEAAPRSTRTKTRKAKPEVSENEDKEEVDSQPTRSTRTKTIKKPDKETNNNNNKKPEEEEVAQETRSTRTKTLKKNAKEQESDKEQSDTESVKSSKSKKPKKPSPKTSENKKDSKSKRNRSDSTDEELPKTERKKSKSNSPNKEQDFNDITGQTEYEDARSTMDIQSKQPAQLNGTYVADNPPTTQPQNLNVTQIIDTVSSVLKEAAPSLTDDESIEIKTPPKKQVKTKPKEVFSPYEKTTTKKKVEAFEKLQQASAAPGSGISNKIIKDPGSAIKKNKYFTPVESKIFNPSSSSTSKISRLISHGTPNESLSQLRTTQKESRERQRKLLEREQAKMKKEAMLQAQAEAKKKLNEEKQLKALQQRKVLEAEKQKQYELQRQKEERLKQREQEREEYLQKQKIENEKKRMEAKKKLQEAQMQKQQLYEEQAKQPPIYMTTRPPLLPTDDCYDSDDQEYQKVVPPSWCTGEQMRLKQFVMMTAGEKIKNTLFCRHAQTPNLIEIFQVIDPKKLKRNSSVLWRDLPRYTMMPDLNETRFSDDDDEP